MSTTRTADVDRAVAACCRTDVTPVEIDAESLDSTAPSYLRDLKSELAADGYQPAAVAATGCFGDDCSLATQEEADRLRDLVRAAAFLGAGRFALTIEEVANPEKVEPALSALAERAERDGVRVRIEGDAEATPRGD